MKHLTWPTTAAFVALITVLAVLFATGDDATRARVLEYFDSLVPFVVGLGAGAAAGGAAGYATGYFRGQAAARAERKVEETGGVVPAASPQPEAVRRAAEAVRVAAEESHLSADQARAAADALRIAAEEGRAVAELQRSLLLETRRTMSPPNEAGQRSWAGVRSAG